MLSVFFGDASAGLHDIFGRQQLPVDAWLLDGFAPDRNPDLWSTVLWRAIAALSADGTTIATFSAVGDVRRGARRRRLRDAQNRPETAQAPHARGHVCVDARSATRETRAASSSSAADSPAPAPRANSRNAACRSRCSTHHRRRRIAWRLRCCIAALLADGGLRRLGYLYAQHWYQQQADKLEKPGPSGVLQFPSSSMNEQRLELAAATYAHTGRWVMPVDATTASALAGIPVRRSALYFPEGRALDLAEWCDALLRDPLIEYRPRRHCERGLDQPGARDRSDRCGGARVRSDRVVRRHRHQQLRSGAISRTRPRVGADRTDRARRDSCCCRWSATVSWFRLRRTGGSARLTNTNPGPRDTAADFNLRRFDQWWLGLAGAEPRRRHLGSVRGARAVTSDRIPIVGGLFDAQGERLARLFVNTGHGSQGTVSAPFAAECIAAEACGEFSPCTRDELALLSSLRFRLRQARRGPRHGARA